MQQRLLRLPEVIAILGLSRSTIYSHIKTGHLPKPIHLSVRTVAWPSSEVESVINARIAGKSETEIAELVRELEARRKVPRHDLADPV